MLNALLTLGFWIGLLIFVLISGKHIGRYINMKLERSHYIHYHYIYKRRYKRNKLGIILLWVAMALIIVGILAILGIFN